MLNSPVTKCSSSTPSDLGHLILFPNCTETDFSKHVNMNDCSIGAEMIFSEFLWGQFVPEDMMCSSLIHCINRIVRSDLASEAPFTFGHSQVLERRGQRWRIHKIQVTLKPFYVLFKNFYYGKLMEVTCYWLRNSLEGVLFYYYY